MASCPYQFRVGLGDITTGVSSCIVAVLDSGIDSHSDLLANIDQNLDWDFVDNDNDAFEITDHVTHVAGIISAIGNNSVGVAGLTWNCKIMPLRVIDSQGDAYDDDIAEAIIYAADNGASVINMSFSGPDYSEILAESVEYAYKNGCVLVAASGNEDTDVGYPAVLPYVIAVGATDYNDLVTWYSNYGYSLDVMAPGGDETQGVLSASADGNYLEMAGTSMVAPQVTGLAALICSKYPTLSPMQVEYQIEKGADQEALYDGWDELYGFGRINTYNSLNNLGSLPNDFDEPNDSLNTAYLVSGANPLRGGSSCSHVGKISQYADDWDLFKFSVSGNLNITVSLTSIPTGCDFDLDVLNAEGESLFYSDNYDNTDEKIKCSLSTGTYYALVNPYERRGNDSDSYSLNFSALGPLALANIYNCWMYPNPFSPNGDGRYDTTSFCYSLSNDAYLTIKVYNYKGEVKTVVNNSYRAAGRHYEGWTGTNNSGQILPEGNYGYTIYATNSAGTRTYSGTTSINMLPSASSRANIYN
ncbi:MAG TPA: hypothetical protein ENN38_03485, partial [Actinobacteria bacterium]|nr:hypothetical protein [Actinomycetota bacterium]